MNDMWGPLAVIGVLFWGAVVMMWPKVKVHADIASRSDVVELQARMQASEMTTLAASKNQAITIVLLAELTGRITESESKFRIIQISNGQYDQTELLKLLLSQPGDVP